VTTAEPPVAAILLTAVLSVLGTLAIQQFQERRLRRSSEKRIRAYLRIARLYIKTMRAADGFLVADDLLFPFRRLATMLEDPQLLADISPELANVLAGLHATIESYLAVVASPNAATRNLEGRVRTMESSVEQALELLGDSRYMHLADKLAREKIGEIDALERGGG
jgi:hypothetical protein